MEALVAGALVAVVAGVFGLGGAVIQARRSHQRWLREVRLSAYVELVSAVSLLTGSRIDVARLVKAFDDRAPTGSSTVQEREGIDQARLRAREKAEAMARDRLAGFDELGVAAARVRLVGPKP
jgi:hypothetical protein